MGKTYRATRTESGPQAVMVVDGPRTYRLPHVVWHSPDGFEWGYAGSGPADLALSILADSLGEKQTPEQAASFDADSGCPRATRLHQRFKREVIADLPQEIGVSWQIDGQKVLAWIDEQEEDVRETLPDWVND